MGIIDLDITIGDPAIPHDGINVKSVALTQADVLSRTGPQRLLVIGGILLIVAGMIFGDVFAVFILHPNAGNIGQAMYGAAAAVAAQEPDAVMVQFKTPSRALLMRPGVWVLNSPADTPSSMISCQMRST